MAEKPILKLKLLVDKEKNKVVFAEAGKDFVYVLSTILALRVGTIVRLLEKYEQNQKCQIGCFNNLYKSVSDMCIDDFNVEACKDMLLYPEKQCNRLSLNDPETLNFTIDDDTEYDEVSVIVTENMKVEFSSIAFTFNTLKELGYVNLDKLEVKFVDVDHKEVLSLLYCLFFSETPLTDVFLNKHTSCGMTRSTNIPTLTSMQDGGEAEPNEVVSLSVYVTKQDMKVFYAESEHEFVDLLFSFLTVPLGTMWEITGSNIELGCIDNFCRSMKSLFSSGRINACGYPCMFPLEYGLHKKNDFSELGYDCDGGSFDSEAPPHNNNGFVKRSAIYRITNDLRITAGNSSSTLDTLMELEVDLKDFESREINISKMQAIDLLRASLTTSQPLSTVLSGLISKIQEE